MLGITQFRRNRDALDVRLAPEAAPEADARILVVIPHCDDETLGTGGFIHAARRRGIAVRVVFTTNGDGSLSTQIAENARRLRRNSFLDLAELRQREALAACAELGMEANDVCFLGFPDRGTAAMWQTHWNEPFRSPFTRVAAAPYPNAFTPNATYCGAQMLRDLETALHDFKPTHIFTTHPDDTHPDHWASWTFSLAALEQLRLGGNAWAAATELRAFPVHRGIWPAPHGYHPHERLAPPADLLENRAWTTWELDGEARGAKKRALECHDSQMAWTPHYLRGFLRHNEIFEIIGTDGIADAPASARGIFLQRIENDTAILRVHLRPAPRGFTQLYLRAVSANRVRAWNVEVHEPQLKEGAARAREISAHQAAREETAPHWHISRGANTFDMAVPLEALDAAAGEVALFVAGEVRQKAPTKQRARAKAPKQRGSVLERTATGVIRLSQQSVAKPILVARADPRYRVR
ncbi:MAG TPA: PIG-L family deacetylase [Abditibacteriaceae bacterium]|jgi:LmbE family N-acetylglucosaminyl deacetylase